MRSLIVMSSTTPFQHFYIDYTEMEPEILLFPTTFFKMLILLNFPSIFPALSAKIHIYSGTEFLGTAAVLEG